MKRYPLVASLSLIIPTAECFVVFGCARSSAPQIRNGGCCSGRRLHHADGYLTPSEAPGGKLTSLIHIGADERRTLVYGSGLIASSRVREVRQDIIALTLVLSVSSAVRVSCGHHKLKNLNYFTSRSYDWLAQRSSFDSIWLPALG